MIAPCASWDLFNVIAALLIFFSHFSIKKVLRFKSLLLPEKVERREIDVG